MYVRGSCYAEANKQLYNKQGNKAMVYNCLSSEDFGQVMRIMCDDLHNPLAAAACLLTWTETWNLETREGPRQRLKSEDGRQKDGIFSTPETRLALIDKDKTREPRVNDDWFSDLQPVDLPFT